MNRIWLKRRPIGVAFLVIVLSYFLLAFKTYDHESSVLISKIHPSDAWEFVADFNNMKYLNPTIVDFDILNESGNYEHWQYTAAYTEKLSHWPHLFNTAIAHFIVKTLPRRDLYYVVSSHSTCLLWGLICLKSNSEFTFTKSKDDGALCVELVQYQCPPILSKFCRREVEFQRNAIMTNLEQHFSRKHPI